MIDNCLYCTAAIFMSDEQGVWLHFDTERIACQPLTIATPSTVRLG